MASTSSETPSLPGSNYDVFLSFRGEDTRHSFTDHLYEAFTLRGIEAFRDSEKLQLGQGIADALIQAIKKSQYAIVVFSEKYADSRWCLDELAEIVECKRLIVVPVFYHVDPSDVRNQTGPFEKDFDKHQKNDKIDREKIQKWKDAMREVGKLSGKHLLNHQRSEAECIQDIVGEVLNKLRNTAHTTELIGMESRVEKLKSYLTIESNDVRIIGIWGTGGMGKTALARVVYGMVSNHFEACCFIANVREESEKCGLCKLQKKLLKKLLMLKKLNLQDVDDGVQMIKNRLHNKKILLVLDDINELDQLEKLAGEHCWFGSGSRIMITTRDKHLLLYHEAKIYEAEVLNHDEALKLFSLKAFKMDHPTEDYGKLSQAFVDYCKGLPLALEVLGSFLFKKSIDEWKSEYDRLMIEFCDRGKILNVLQISFDGLQPNENNIFLNIACFFNHKNKDDVIKILNYLELHVEIGLGVLINKSLIKLHENQLWMHDLLQDMGRHIVCQRLDPICQRLDPAECSRLWSFEDINNVLTENTGTEKIQGIVLELHEPKNVKWNLEAFSKMRNLKLLKICGVQLMHDLKHLPSSLRVLDWRGYPSEMRDLKLLEICGVKLMHDLKHLPSSSRVLDWGGYPSISLISSFLSKCFENLKFIALKLTEGPDIINIPNLKSLVLQNCINLRRIHPSIGIHTKLTVLDLMGCKNLTSLPSKFEIECLTELNLNWCSKLTEIPEFGRNMKRVRHLHLSGTAITTLPTSIEHLTALESLSSGFCKNLVCLPDTIFNLKLVREVYLWGCSKLDRLPENLGNAESLISLNLNVTAIRKVPSSIGRLKHLSSLDICHCKGLSSNKSWYELLPFYSMPTSHHPVDLLFSSLSLSPAPSLTRLLLRNCNLTAIPNDIGSLISLEWLALSGNDFVCLPESIIRLSNLTLMELINCTSLRSLPKLPLNLEYVEADGCISLEMSADPLKPSDSLEPSLYLRNCFQLADNQSCIDWFISGIEKSLKIFSLPLSVQKIESYPCKKNDIVIPGSEISEWFSHQSMGTKVNIKQPSHLCNQWMGIAICVVFCSRYTSTDTETGVECLLTANGKRTSIGNCSSYEKFLSDHLWLIYVTPQFFNKKSKEILWEGDANGFSQIGIKIETSTIFGSNSKVKKCGIRMIYKKDIEDPDQTMAQYSNSSITPYDGLECHKVKRSRDDCDGAGPSGEGSSNETHGNSDSEESSEYKDCDEELSDRDESNDDSDEDYWEEDRDDSDCDFERKQLRYVLRRDLDD